MASTNLGTSPGDILTAADVNTLLKFDASDNVGIGVTSGLIGQLEVRKDQASATTIAVRNTSGLSGSKAEIKLFSNVDVVSGINQISMIRGSNGADWALGQPEDSDDFVISGGTNQGDDSPSLGTSERLRITSSGVISSGGETSPDASPGGMTFLVSDSGPDISISMKNSNMSHGMTSLAETDTNLKIRSNIGGGFHSTFLQCYGDNNTGLTINSYVVTPDTSDTGSGIYNFDSAKKSGTSSTSLSSNENILSLRNSGVTKVTFKENGAMYNALTTESFKLVDAGSTGATEQDWIEVEVGGNTGYIRVFATK